jgi:histidyl-tRNA synthetase
MMSANIPESKAEVDRMTELLSLLGEYKLNGRITVDLALARGLNYYTGFVWEFIIEEDGKRMPSIGAGGRYDNLIETLSKRSVPAVGSSLGISRIFDLIAPEDGKKTYAKVFIAFIGQQNRGYAISVANMLRGNGVYVDLNTTSRNLSKQMEYAGSLRIRNVLILGDKEREQGKVKFRNMETGVEELISIEEAIRKLKVQE